MNKETIIITVDDNLEINIDVQNVKGKKCEKMTKELGILDKLKIEENKRKPEYYVNIQHNITKQRI